jgi:hypothetical protein
MPPSSMGMRAAPVSARNSSAYVFHDSQLVSSASTSTAVSLARNGEASVPAATVVLGYLTVNFGFRDRPALSVIICRDAGGWRIARYQVSRLG